MEIANQPLTALLVVLTLLVSYQGFRSPSLQADLMFLPAQMEGRRDQWHRFITHGFVHADWIHLIFNMYALWSFGGIMEYFFRDKFGVIGNLLYLMLYLSALVTASIPSFYKHRHNSGYAALGASGAVSAIVFAFILICPVCKISLFFIPIGIPGVIIGALYLAYSNYMARRGTDNIGHDAHFWGAVYGLFFTLLLDPLGIGGNFIFQLQYMW